MQKAHRLGTWVLVPMLSTLFFNCQAQSQPGTAKSLYHKLSVGDTVPDYQLKNLLNYPSRQEKLANFRGKLVILDFWWSHCASCIEAFPKMQALQKEFDGRLQIILTDARENEASVRKTFASRKKLMGLDVTLPTVAGDSVLGDELFPHNGEPYEVWIGPDGVVRSITQGTSVNAKNISRMLAGEQFEMTQADEPELHIDYRKPLFLMGNGGNGEGLIWESVLSKKVPGLPAVSDIFAKPGRMYNIKATNVTIRYLYSMAYSTRRDQYGKLKPMPPNRIVLETRDTTALVEMVDGEYQEQNKYVYQQISPPTTKERMLVAMQSDLKRYFGLNARWEKRKIKCLVLTADDTTLISYKSGLYKLLINDGEMSANAVTVQAIVDWLEYGTEYYYGPYPIFDETGLKGKVGDISFNANIYDRVALDRALSQYKMHFKMVEREVDLLVLKDPE